MAGSTGLYLWQTQSKNEAALQFTSLPTSSSANLVNVDIQVTAGGEVLVDGKDFSKSLKILPNSYEIRILVLDEPGVYIQNFRAIMHLPGKVQPNEIKQRIIAIHGAEHNYNAYIIDSQTLAYVASAISPQGEITIVAELPKTLLSPPLGKKIVYTLSQVPAKSYIIISIILPLLTFAVMIFMIIRRRQDQIFHLSRKINNTPPTDSPPAVIGALVDGQVGAREIAATLIDLAVRGYLYITSKGDGQFSFGKRKSLALENLAELREFERILLSKIFEAKDYKSTRQDVDMRVGRHIFSRKIAQVYLNIYDEATNLGFFVQNPVRVHLYWKYAGVGLFFLGLIGFALAAIFSPDPKFILFFWAGGMAASLVIIWLAGLMPARSITGSIALRKWLEFRNYLNLNRSVEPGANIMDKFSQLLPYAVVFGLESEWARRFLKERFAKPDWYESEDRAITLENFVGHLYPIIEYVGGSLARSHEPTVE